MTLCNKPTLNDEIIKKALEFGACLAGIANVAELKKSPSHIISQQIAGNYTGVGIKHVEGRKPGEVVWPDNAKSAVVIAVEHPSNAPDMDWWVKGLKGGTKGNAELMAVFSKLSDWLKNEKNMNFITLAYHIEHGAIFMKDTAVLGGLGCIGKNNMLVTPQFGSRIRLRVLLLEKDLPSTGIMDFDPCTDCEEFCRKACPEKAFDEKIYSQEKYGQTELPGRTGVYSRARCGQQMAKNAEKGEAVEIEGIGKTERRIKYCRRCERACPVGRS